MNDFLAIDTDLWTYLAETAKPIVMYGMGNGADKILAVCEKRGITVSDFFASDGFVRGHSFHGKRVLSYSEIKDKYDDFIVLLSFASSLPNVIHAITEISREHELYVPDVPVFGDTLFDLNFYRLHEKDFVSVSELFADERSVETLKSVILAKLTGKLEHIFASVCEKDEVFESILRPESYRGYADLGAYNGDTIRELARYAPNLERVYAVEPDKRNFKKLSDYAESEDRFDIRCTNAAAWSVEEQLFFDGSGNRNSNISSSAPSSKKITEVCGVPLDDIVSERVDFIKYDVEGSELEALSGSRKTIERFSPDLLVSAYHRSEDLFAVPRAVKELCGDHKLYLRRFMYIPCWDLNLYAVRDSE